MSHTLTIPSFIERHGQELPVSVTLEYSFEPGHYLESGHPMNTFGRGWVCDNVTVRDQAGHEVEVTDEEVADWRDSNCPH